MNSKKPPPGADAFFSDMVRQYAPRFEDRKTAHAIWTLIGRNCTAATARRHLKRMADQRKIQSMDGKYWAPPWSRKEDAETP